MRTLMGTPEMPERPEITYDNYAVHYRNRVDRVAKILRRPLQRLPWNPSHEQQLGLFN